MVSVADHFDLSFSVYAHACERSFIPLFGGFINFLDLRLLSLQSVKLAETFRGKE